MNRIRAASRNRRLIAAFTSVFVLVAIGAFVLRHWVNQSLASAEAIEATGELALDAIRDAHGRTCVRPVLRGEAVNGDGSADLVALLSAESPFASCLSYIGEHLTEVEDAIWLCDGRVEPLPEDTTRTEGEDDPPPPDVSFGWDYQRQTRRLHTEPLAIEREILTRCTRLDVEVERIVQHASACTPFPLGSGDEDIRLLRLTKGLVVFARDRMQRGETRRGFELLLDAEQLALDAQRGRPQLVGAMLAVAAMGVVHAQVQWLLLNDLPWTSADLLALTPAVFSVERRGNFTHAMGCRRLTCRELSSARTARREIPEQAIVEPSETSDEAARGVVAFAHYAYTNTSVLCEGVVTMEGCAARYAAEQSRVSVPQNATALRFARVFPNIARETFHASMLADWLVAIRPHMERAWHVSATRSALPLLFVGRRLALDGHCPSAEALEAEAGALLTPPSLGGQLQVLSSNIEFEPLEICAPAWLAPAGAGRARLPLLDSYCPVFPLVQALERR